MLWPALGGNDAGRFLARQSNGGAEGNRGFSLWCGEATVSCSTDSEADSAKAMPADHPQLMVVDDDPEVRVIVAEFLEDFGYDVLQASSGIPETCRGSERLASEPSAPG